MGKEKGKMEKVEKMGKEKGKMEKVEKVGKEKGKMEKVEKVEKKKMKEREKKEKKKKKQKLTFKELKVLDARSTGEMPNLTIPYMKKGFKLCKKKGLITEDFELTERGKEEIQWRKALIKETGRIRLKPAGGFDLDHGFVYEPLSSVEYIWNWVGFRGVSTVQVDPDTKKGYIRVKDKMFFFSGNLLDEKEVVFQLPNRNQTDLWVKGKIDSLSTRELWDECRNYFKRFIDLSKEFYYDILCVSTFQSWLVHMLRSVFYVAIIGEYGSGKTIIGESTVGISRHGYFVGNPSVAWVGRALERLQVTPFFDEFDSIAGEMDSELYQIIRVGQRKGAKYSRVTKHGVPQSFDVFGPKYLSIHGEIEGALRTRTMPIITTETENYSYPILNFAREEFSTVLYTKLFLWYLDNIYLLYSSSYNSSSYNKVSNVGHVSPIATTKSKKNILNILLRVLSDPQQTQLKKHSGRDIELAYNFYRITNLLGININESIKEAFNQKAKIEEEAKEVGVLGMLRDFMVDKYKDKKSLPNYRLQSGEFAITNKECSNDFREYLHRREKRGVTRSEFKGLLRELGFSRASGSRDERRMYTEKELENFEKLMDEAERLDSAKARKELEGLAGKPVRLCNIFTPRVFRKLGIKQEELRKSEND